MNVLNNLRTNQNPDEEFLVMVPFKLLDSIEQKQDELIKLIQSGQNYAPTVKEYISEDEAKTLLKKGKSWFFNMRNSGRLSGVKIGATRYYKMTEIEQLFNNSL